MTTTGPQLLSERFLRTVQRWIDTDTHDFADIKDLVAALVVDVRGQRAQVVEPTVSAPCEECFYHAWAPVLMEDECAFVHPHRGDHVRCDYCWLRKAKYQPDALQETARALVVAKETIRKMMEEVILDNGQPEGLSFEQVWAIHQDAPHMKQINAAIELPATRLALRGTFFDGGVDTESMGDRRRGRREE